MLEKKFEAKNFLSFFLGIEQFQAHFLIKVFLIKKNMYLKFWWNDMLSVEMKFYRKY